ncbi:hypothetical protein AUQ24_05695 [Escherichia coli]|nr:hypothetical protein AUQ24_05695 [Escherichia coli]
MRKLSAIVIYVPIKKPVIIPDVVIIVMRIIFITKKFINIFSYVPFDAQFSVDDILRAITAPGIIDILIYIIIVLKNLIHHLENIFEVDVFTLPFAVRANLKIISSFYYMLHDIFIVHAFMTNILIFPHFLLTHHQLIQGHFPAIL